MLTKSDFMKFLQCPKALWLGKYRKDLIPKVDANQQVIFDNGYLVQDYAYKLFPEGKSAILEEGSFNEQLNYTKQLISQKTKVIYEATIATRDLWCRADILVYNESTELYDLYEVKSGTSIKDENLYDITFQMIAFREAGIKIGNYSAIYVNNEYVKHGDIDPKGLLTIENVNDSIKELENETRGKMDIALSILNKKNIEPNVRILKQCHNPYECPFIDYCWKNIPEESIYELGKLSEDTLNVLLDKNVLLIKDIPEELLGDFRNILYYKTITDTNPIIDKNGIKEEIEKIKYPIYFIDYETYSPAVPIIDGYRPYQRIIFQYSLHIQKTPDSELEHHYFLAKELKDPTRELAQSLKDLDNGNGSYISWNEVFEKGCNKEMGERDSMFTEYFQSVNDRMIDLIVSFRKGYCWHREFKGSASIKKVLPVLVPELSYSELDIHEGGTASNKWFEMVSEKTPQEERDKIYNNLLTYCGLDTMAMVRILEKLKEIAK